MQPLLPEEAVEYLDDAKELRKNYLKAVSIRNCLEAIVDTVFIHIAKAKGKAGKWHKKRLVDKIESLKNFFPDEILEVIHYIRKVTNKGAHQSGHKDLTEDEINESLGKINRICEWVIAGYLKKYGFVTESWVPTVLSTLQPIYRIRILEDLFNYFLKAIKNKDELIKYQEDVQKWHDMQLRQIASGNMLDFEEHKHNEVKKQFKQLLLVN